MIEETEQGSNDELAVAIARGVAIAAWARAKKVPRTTAFRWAEEPDVRKAVQDCRRRIVDQAIGRITKVTNQAADTIANLCTQGDSHAVRLRAAQAVFSEMIAVSKYSDLEQRMTELEAMVPPVSVGSSTHWSQGPTNYGYGNASPANP
jgi:hypothetical protein